MFNVTRLGVSLGVSWKIIFHKARYCARLRSQFEWGRRTNI